MRSPGNPCTYASYVFKVVVFFGYEMRWQRTWPFQLEWQPGLVSWQWPFSVHAIHSAWSGSIRLVYSQIWGVWELFWACLATGKQGEEDDKRITVKIFPLLKMHMWVALQCYIRRPVSVSEHHSPPACIFLSFCSAPSLAHSLTSSIISLLSVNLAPCLPLSLFSPFPFSPSLPPSLPPSHFPSLHVPLSIVVICPVANSASVCLSRLSW